MMFSTSPRWCAGLLLALVALMLLCGEQWGGSARPPRRGSAAAYPALYAAFPAATSALGNLVQLSEAVLAPAWGTGGYAYTLKVDAPDGDAGGFASPVCVHTRASTREFVAPFTFAMFDAQFSPLYEVRRSTSTDVAGDAEVFQTRVVGRLDLMRGCYIAAAVTSVDACMGFLRSEPEQCERREHDALRFNWTASSIAHAVAAATEGYSPNTSLSSSKEAGLSGSELFTVFVQDYLPQRAWLRTAMARPIDAISSAVQAATVYASAKASSSSAAEEGDARRAVAAEWNRYLWSSYIPLLQRKWTLLRRFAMSTLTPVKWAPSFHTSTTESITGEPPSTAKTTCTFVEAWPQWRYAPRRYLTLAQLVTFMRSAIGDLATVLTKGAKQYGEVAEQMSAVALAELLSRTNCAALTYLLSLTALLDAPFLRAATSVWIETATHADSWALQTMQDASENSVLGNASAFHEATVAEVKRVTASMSHTEQRFMSCLSSFLNARATLGSASAVSPAACVQALRAYRMQSAGVPINDRFTTIWDADLLSPATSTSASSVPGIVRWESTIPLRGNESSSSDSPHVRWALAQSARNPLTGQTSFFTPSIEATSPPEPCKREEDATQTHTMSNASIEGLHAGSGAAEGQGDNACPAGTYVSMAMGRCVTCPSLCATAQPTPLYCPGDGLLHGCPGLPEGATYAVQTTAVHTNASAACRYVCRDVYQAPIQNSCLSAPGYYYGTVSASKNHDERNGGWLAACREPTELLPSPFPALAMGRAFVFVGSGAVDEPSSCRFVLLHRGLSYAVPTAALDAVGLLPGILFVPAVKIDSSLSSEVGSPAVRGVAWEAAVLLNASLLWAMHQAQWQSNALQQAQPGDTTSSTGTTIGHELMTYSGIGESGKAALPRLSWYLQSTLESPTNTETIAPFRPSPSTASRFCLRLLLNVSSVLPAGNDQDEARSPPPSSLVVRSAAWYLSWASPLEQDTLATATYRVVLDRMFSTVTFYVDGTQLGNSVTVDWPLWAYSVSSASTKVPLPAQSFLSVSGWVARYMEEEQWMMRNASSSAVGGQQIDALPLAFEYVPGMVTRLSTSTAAVSPLQEALVRGEMAWHVQALLSAAEEGRDIAAHENVSWLAWYVASVPECAANVSATLIKLSLRSSQGLDGVCRSGYGMLRDGSSTSLPSEASPCEPCVSGAYTQRSTLEVRGVCQCVPQRVMVKDSSTNTQQSQVCQLRPTGPAVPLASLRPAGFLCVDKDVVRGGAGTYATDRIPLGSYVLNTSASAAALPAATSLKAQVGCVYGLSVPLVSPAPSASSSGPLHASAALEYTTGLGAEDCTVVGTAYGEDTVEPLRLRVAKTQPTHTTSTTYCLRLQAPPLHPRSITLTNNSRLFTDQTVLSFGVRDYALLPAYAVQSLLHMDHLTEYHVAFLVYVVRSATVSAILRCGRSERHFSWAVQSTLDTKVLHVNLTDIITENCVVSISVQSAPSCLYNASPPLMSWPYAYLTSNVDATHFLEASPALQYILRPSAETFATSHTRYDPLRETSTVVISCVLCLLSSLGVILLFLNERAPTLQPLSWRPYERALGRLHAGSSTMPEELHATGMRAC